MGMLLRRYHEAEKPELEHLSKDELVALAKERGIENATTMKKAELVAILGGE